MRIILLPLEIHRFPVVYYTPRISKYFLLKFPTFICLVITILTPYIYACHYYTHPFSFSHCPKNITTTACRYAQSRPLPFFDSLTNDTISSKGLHLTASSPTHNYLPQKRKRHHITRRTNTIYITIHERGKKKFDRQRDRKFRAFFREKRAAGSVRASLAGIDLFRSREPITERAARIMLYTWCGSCIIFSLS